MDIILEYDHMKLETTKKDAWKDFIRTKQKLEN
jgi:hypothetical protein